MPRWNCWHGGENTTRTGSSTAILSVSDVFRLTLENLERLSLDLAARSPRVPVMRVHGVQN